MLSLRLTDRYVISRIVAPFFLGVLVLTFLLMIPPMREVGEDLMARGIEGATTLRILLLLLPQAVALTIPMALLVGLLMGLGRLSGDRELVAMQACGISFRRLAGPVGLVAVSAALASCYLLVVVQPQASQLGRNLTLRTLAAQSSVEIQPRVFFQEVPNLVLYVRDVAPTDARWQGVFMAELQPGVPPKVYVARHGRLAVDIERRQVDVVLERGTGHYLSPERPHEYQVHEFDELILGLDPEVVLPGDAPPRHADMTLSQLRGEIDASRERGESPHRPIMEVHRKFSIPAACLVFAIIGLTLGVSNRKDSRLDSFVLGIGVIFAYYVIMYTAEAMAKGALVSPHLALWIPNIILATAGLVMLWWQGRSVERQSRSPLSVFIAGPTTTLRPTARSTAAPRGWGARTLDLYVSRSYLTVLMIALAGLLGILYISIFIDLSDKLFKGQATGRMLLEFFWYSTPQYSYYTLPLAALIATLVTVGSLTKTSELTVMKACGISVYRMSAPLFAFGLLWSGLLLGMGETFLAEANLKAESVRHAIRGGSPQTFDILDRRWIVGESGATIYHYEHLDPARDELNGVTIYELSEEPWRLTRRTYATRARFDGGWRAVDMWVREFETPADGRVSFRTVETEPLTLEPPDYFETEQPKADRMNYRQLDQYIQQLRATGLDIPALSVSLHRKFSFPLIPLVMTVIAIPFALTTGRRGALLGIGLGLVLACAFWIVTSAARRLVDLMHQVAA